MLITAAQCRAARALLDWSQDELALQASVNKWTILRFERGKAVSRNTIHHLRRALEGGGVIFLAADGEANAGVRLAKGAGQSGGGADVDEDGGGEEP